MAICPYPLCGTPLKQFSTIYFNNRRENVYYCPSNIKHEFYKSKFNDIRRDPIVIKLIYKERGEISRSDLEKVLLKAKNEE